MLNDVPRMPEPVENNSFIPTLDRQGAIWLYVDEITQAYLDFAGQTKGTLLEIAAGYGHIVIKALEAGAGRVFANESMPISWRSEITDAGRIFRQTSLLPGTISGAPRISRRLFRRHLQCQTLPFFRW
jgi:hypothetical protein